MHLAKHLYIEWQAYSAKQFVHFVYTEREVFSVKQYFI